MAQAPPSTSRQNLVCAVCREVYQSPRLLPNCYHSFCLHCLDGMVRTHGRSFPCPTCRTIVRVPEGGVRCFKVNFYIPEEDLERERNQAFKPMCGTHRTEELIFFCKQCDLAICWRCKLTKHENHPTEDLFDTAVHCKKLLKSSRKRLEKSVKRLNRMSALSQDNRKAAKQKADALREQIKEQCQSTVAMVTRQRDQALRDLDTLTYTMDNDLNTHFNTVQRHLDSLIQLQQRVSHAIDSSNDAEVVVVEKEAREGEGSVEELRKVERSLSTSTQRPGLQREMHVLRQQDLAVLFGTPVCLHLPSVTSGEYVNPLYRCEEINGCREVHAVYWFYNRYLSCQSIAIAYGGRAPVYEDETVIKIDITGTQIEPGVLMKRNVSFMGQRRFRNDLCDCIGNEHVIYSKSYTDTRVVLQNQPPKAFLNCSDASGDKSKKGIKFDLEDASTPLAIDTDSRQQILIVLSEDISPPTTTRAITEPSPLAAAYIPPKMRTVQMYLPNQSKPVSRYTPPQQPFFPTDVCFWHGGPNPRLLLISDMATDNVHVVSVENHQFQFVRYLASGSPNVLRPTALDAWCGAVSIGCENGWVLRCLYIADAESDESEEEEMKEEEEEEESDGESEGGGRQLQVENDSESTVNVNMTS